MKRLVVLCISALCIFARQDQQVIPKPQELGQFFCVKDGKLIPLQEEKDVYASSTLMYDISVKLKKAQSATTLENGDQLQFVVHLSDKSIGSYVLFSITKEKKQRTFRIGQTQRKIL